MNDEFLEEYIKLLSPLLTKAVGELLHDSQKCLDILDKEIDNKTVALDILKEKNQDISEISEYLFGCYLLEAIFNTHLFHMQKKKEATEK